MSNLVFLLVHENASPLPPKAPRTHQLGILVGYIHFASYVYVRVKYMGGMPCGPEDLLSGKFRVCLYAKGLGPVPAGPRTPPAPGATLAPFFTNGQTLKHEPRPNRSKPTPLVVIWAGATACTAGTAWVVPGVAKLPTPPAGCRDADGGRGPSIFVSRASSANRFPSAHLQSLWTGRVGASVPELIPAARRSHSLHGIPRRSISTNTN